MVLDQFRPRDWAKSVALLAVSVFASALLGFTFEPFLGEHTPFLAFTLAVIVCAWYGGLIIGLLTTLVSSLVADYFFLSPIHRFDPIDSHQFGVLALFIVVGVSTSLLQSALAESNEALKRSREQVRLAAEAGRIGFSESFDGEKVVWTPEMEKLFGLEPGAFEGTLGDWIRRIHPDDRKQFLVERRAQLDERQPSAKYEYRAILPGGQIRWLEGRRRLFFSETGSLARIVSAAVDITDRHELEQKLSERAQKLYSSNHELERFAHKVAHELQGPVRAIGSMSQLALRRANEGLSGESIELLDMVVANAQRMGRLVEDMLELARITHAPDMGRPVDVAEIARTAAANVGARSDTPAEICVEDLPTIRADGRQLQSLFENLIGNAVKYRGGKIPSIRISASRAGGEWVFAVQDNGIGIDPAYHERIFEEFQRLHSESEIPGSGIGLSICRNIVERHNGRIWVESKPGEGATFRFAIPQSAHDMTAGDPEVMHQQSATG
jgi:PAS domain S-box-containing protein